MTGVGNQDVLCTLSDAIGTADDDSCTSFNAAEDLRIGDAGGSHIVFNGAFGTANFNSTTVQFNSSTVAFGGGTTTLGGTVTVNNNLTTNGITNTGLIISGSLSSNTIFGNSATITNILSANGSFTDSLTVIGSANVTMGGNIVHGVAAGVADTDAVNVAQLIAATSGVATDITALETMTATHTTQIATLETTTATHTTQIASLDATTATHTTQIGNLETTTATHTTQIAAVEAVNTTQATQISAIQAVNTTQTTQISALQAVQDSLEGSVDTLFELRSSDRRDMKQGVAAAMSMASAPMPSEPGRVAYAVNGAMFRGEKAVGGSLQYRLNTCAPMAIGVGFSYAGNKNNGVRVGVAGEF
ncbi:MAG: hypothetical protein M3Q19_13330 [Pseudomonadota bacterium]|nr:hypothetical protein [Pseudomonadota bacterium]